MVRGEARAGRRCHGQDECLCAHYRRVPEVWLKIMGQHCLGAHGDAGALELSAPVASASKQQDAACVRNAWSEHAPRLCFAGVAQVAITPGKVTKFYFRCDGIYGAGGALDWFDTCHGARAANTPTPSPSQCPTRAPSESAPCTRASARHSTAVTPAAVLWRKPAAPCPLMPRCIKFCLSQSRRRAKGLQPLRVWIYCWPNEDEQDETEHEMQSRYCESTG